MGLIGLILVLLAVAFLLRVDFIFYIVYVCVGVYILSRWYTPAALRQLRVERRFNDHAFLGETVKVELLWHNQGRLPLPWIEFTESVAPVLRIGEPIQQALSLGGRQRAVTSYEVQAAQRGYYRLGPLRMTVGDLFGIVPRKQGSVGASHLTVYPHIIPLSNLGLPSRLPFGTIASHQRLFEDPARPFGIRDYRSGDSPRRIHWKASAHTNSLVVKTLEPAISLETAVFLNLHRGDFEPKQWRYYSEWAITVAASLAAHLIGEKQAVGLITNGVDPLQGMAEVEATFDEDSGRLLRQDDAGATLPPRAPDFPLRQGRAHLIKILERLARVESDFTVPLNAWARNASVKLAWGVTLLVVTPRGDDATCQTLHQLVRAGFNPILIAVEPTYRFGPVRERARQLGFQAFNVTERQDLAQWREAGPKVHR